MVTLRNFNFDTILPLNMSRVYKFPHNVLYSSFFLSFFPATTSRQVSHIAFNFYVYLFSFNIPLFRHIWCVLLIRFRLIIFGRSITKVVLCSFQCIISGCTQLVKVVSTRFLHCKGAFPPL